MEKIDNPQVAFQQDHAGMKDTLEAEAQRAFRRPREPRPDLTPEFLDKKATDYTYEYAAQQVKARREKYEAGRFYQETATVKIRGRDPISVTMIGDVHFGSALSDEERFEADAKRIEEHEGQYAVLMGNLIDNAIPGQFPSNMLANELHPEEQVAAMRQRIAQMDNKGKVLAALGAPCHEGWTWSHAGQDVNRLLFEGRNFPVLDNGGELTIKVGEGGKEQDYKIALYHQIGRFESQLNKSNAPQRMQQLRNQEADVVVGAHRHIGEAMQTYVGQDEKTRKPKVFIRSGTYKTKDKWARDRGFGSGEPGGESVMLWPDQKKMQPFLNPETATETHEAIKQANELKRMGMGKRMDKRVNKKG
jgi:hypothetical protein